MSKQIKAVVVGCGAIGPIHAEAVSQSEYGMLYGVCDVLAERAEALAKQFGCRAFSSYEDVLADPAVECVHICTPHFLHGDMLLRAARAGKHVVVEKPLALNAAEAEAVTEAASSCAVQICPVLQNRFIPCIEQAKQVVESGAYGRVLSARGVMTWQRTPAYYASEPWRGKRDTEGGGLVINQAVHMLDMLTYLSGAAESVSATAANRTLDGVIEVEDTAEATFYTADGRHLFFYGTNGYCGNTPFDLEVCLEQATLKFCYDRLLLLHDGEWETLAVNAEKVPGKPYWGGGHYVLIDRFYQALVSGGESPVPVADGVYAVRLVSGLYRSAQSGKREMI